MKNNTSGTFTVSIKKSLTASHSLDEPGEKEQHAHDYTVMFACEGDSINEKGFLIDILELKRYADELLSYLDKKLLNTLDEFRMTPPSIEQISRLLCQGLAKKLKVPNVSAVTVTVKESDDSRASFRKLTR